MNEEGRKASWRNVLNFKLAVLHPYRQLERLGNFCRLEVPRFIILESTVCATFQNMVFWSLFLHKFKLDQESYRYMYVDISFLLLLVATNNAARAFSPLLKMRVATAVDSPSAVAARGFSERISATTKDENKRVLMPTFFPYEIHQSDDSSDIWNRLVQVLDVNGDGWLDVNDIQTLVPLVLLLWLCMAPPAAAKGGGSGRSSSTSGSSYRSSGGSSRSSIRSSTRSGSSSYDSRSDSYGSSSSPSVRSFVDDDLHYPDYRRGRVRDRRYARPFDPAACSNLPGEDEFVKVLVNPYFGFYSEGNIVGVNEKLCRFTVAYHEPYGDATKTFGSTHNWMDWSIGGAVAVNFVGMPIVAAVVRATEDITERVRSMENTVLYEWEKASTKAESFSCPPVDGVYVGETVESDGISQSVQVNLKFTEDGEVEGSGKDSMDGDYIVRGKWSSREIEWTEEYRRGSFFVEVKGIRLGDGNELSCLFRSSNGVTGLFRVMLQAKRKSWWRAE